MELGKSLFLQRTFNRTFTFSVRNDTSTILFEVQKPEPIPLWIFIAASVGGLLIVLIIIIIMWKVIQSHVCFFNFAFTCLFLVLV